MTIGQDASKDSFLVRAEAYQLVGKLQRLPPEAVSEELIEKACLRTCSSTFLGHLRAQTVCISIRYVDL
jgi:hypothetical protein